MMTFKISDVTIEDSSDLGMVFGHIKPGDGRDKLGDMTNRLLEAVETITKSLYETSDGVHRLQIHRAVTDFCGFTFSGMAYKLDGT